VDGACVTTEKKSTYMGLLGRPERKKTSWKP